MSNSDLRAHFNENPIAEVRSIPSSPISSSSSPGQSIPPPLPNVAFSSPTNSTPSLSPDISPPHPHIRTPSPIPQVFTLPYVPPAPLIPGICLHPELVAPNLQYDVRYLPSQSNPQLSPAILAKPASDPPLSSLGLRVGDLPWMFNAFPDAALSPGRTYVTVHDVLLAIHYHLCTAVKSAEYEAMSNSRKAEISREFENRVGSDPAQYAKGLRRVDFLNGRVLIGGIVRAHSEDSAWEVVVDWPPMTIAQGE
jgi:hypothetical protein